MRVDLHPAHRIGRHLRVAFRHIGEIVVHYRSAFSRHRSDSVVDLAAVASLINWVNSP
jgi:hypothetical protein